MNNKISSSFAINTMPQGASLPLRLGVWLYDFIILLAIEMLATGAVVALFALMVSIGWSIKGYADVGDYLTRAPVISQLFTLYIFTIAALFYSYFWTCFGQTIGMKTWKLKIVSGSGGKITFTQAMIRMVTSCFGLGNILVLFDKNNRAFQDHLSNSQVIKID